LLTDSTGKVVKEYRYDAFGNKISFDTACGVVTTGTFAYFGSLGAQKVSVKAPG